MTRKQKKNLIRICVSVPLIASLVFIPMDGTLKFVLFFVPYLLLGYDVLIKAVKGISRGKPFDENFLMAVATVGAFCMGDSFEGCAVMLFYQVGELFESIAVGKSRKNVIALMDIRPDRATLINENGEETVVSPDEVPVGSLILVKAGEKIPLDGRVVKGDSSLDTSALSGESVPRTVRAGDSVVSGSINLSGVLTIRTEKAFSESTVSKITQLMESASSKKSKSEKFIAKFSAVYTPFVVISALVLAVVPPLIGLIFGGQANFGEWVSRALTFLVISCPCALVISIPLSFFASIGGAGHVGILVKGSDYMEALSKVKTVAFDKTGTLTEGVFEVSGIHHCVIEDNKLIEYASLCESFSTHPIAQSIIKKYGRVPDKSRVSDEKEYSGEGIVATVDGKTVAVGNDKLMRRLGAEYSPCHCSGTVVHVTIDGVYSGHILISDKIKQSSAEAIDSLKKAGVKTVMLTGDAKSVGEDVANKLGIDKASCELLPSDKVEQVERLIEEKPEKTNVAFVGDGINDAPVLARADVGIAMGALGSDAAIEASDVVIMDDNPQKIHKAIKIAKKCMRIVYENVAFALGVKAVCLVLGAIGIASMWMAVFADVGVMMIAVLNAIRALKT